MKRSARAAIVGAALAGVATFASCGGDAPARETAPTVALTPAPTGNVIDLPQAPETYGLVPLSQLQADPVAVARTLVGQLGDTAWTVVWRASVAGEDSGTMTTEHLPAEGGAADRLHVQGQFTFGERSMEIHVLDEGGVAHACLRDKQQPYVCDEKDVGVFSQLLSVSGLQKLAQVVQDALHKPGAAVQYKLIASEPATCFLAPPQPLSVETLGIDFESGGTVCFARNGAILKLETGTLDLEAIEFTTSADPANFKMPV